MYAERARLRLVCALGSVQIGHRYLVWTASAHMCLEAIAKSAQRSFNACPEQINLSRSERLGAFLQDEVDSLDEERCRTQSWLLVCPKISFRSSG